MSRFEAGDCPDVIVTAGGTRENIDDVRYIGNFSSGRLGHALAAEYAQAGLSVLLLAPNAAIDRFGLPDGQVEHQPFTSAESLRQAMLARSGAKIIMHAAAVADYMPERTEGKISSDQEELTLKFKRVPKILPLLRGHFGSETTIVGFKLLSGVSREVLIETATRQIADNKTDFCVANDLQNLNNPSWGRLVHMVRPNREYESFIGHPQTVARRLAGAIAIKEYGHAKG